MSMTYLSIGSSASEDRIGGSGRMFSNAGSSAKEGEEKTEVADNVATCKMLPHRSV
jgi:hypothetical protein